jgi:hypothetical protein
LHISKELFYIFKAHNEYFVQAKDSGAKINNTTFERYKSILDKFKKIVRSFPQPEQKSFISAIKYLTGAMILENGALSRFFSPYFTRQGRNSNSRLKYFV